MSNILQFAGHFGRYLIGQNFQHLIVHVTNHCNFRCQHCFIDFSPKRDLKLEQYQKLAKEVGPLFWLDIGGGEPFLRKDLAEIIAFFDAKVVQIPSNGSLPELMIEQLEKMKRLSKAEISISLSLDGLKETHDRIRKQPGNWDQIWSTFDLLRNKGITVKINTVLTNENKGEILDLMRFVRGREPDFHSIILLRGEPANPDTALPPIDELRILGKSILDILQTYSYGKKGFSANILRNYHKTLWDVSLRTLEEKTQVIPCYAGKSHMVVNGDGGVSSCELLPSVGNIKDSSWREITTAKKFLQQKQGNKDKKCHCTHNCAMLDSILFNPRQLPNLLRS